MTALRLTGGRIVRADGAFREELAIAGGRVVAGAGRDARTLDVSGYLVVPALVNAHDHLPLNAVPCPRPIPPKPSAAAWIDAFQPLFSDPLVAAARAIPEEVRARHGALKNLLSGTTAVAHHDAWLAAFDEAEFPVAVVRRFGWCHSLGLAGRYGPGVAESRAATPPGAPWFVHLAEGWDEDSARELDVLERLGALGPETVLVHGVGLTDAQVERVVASGARVVWCPSSNLLMLGRTLDGDRLSRLAGAGRLALATDSRLTGGFDLLAELRTARAVSGLSPRALFPLVTERAAEAVAERDRGHLRPGARADLLLLADAGGDPHEALGMAGRAEIRAVFRDGRPALADASFATWFDEAGLATRALTLDGVAKLADARLLAPDAARLEPGLSLGGER